jgi:mannosyltransferase OCH1-like enzyme
MKHIKNPFSVIDNASDIIVNIYYISSNKCRIITRQFDLPISERLEIKIDDEVVVINPFIQINDIMLNHVILEEEDDFKEQRIPKIIIQTSETLIMNNAMETIKDFNPEYEYRFFTDIQRREFLKNTFSQKIIDAYDMLVPGAFKADLFRYGYLFIHGGCYFDDKMIAREALKNIILPEDDLLLCEDAESESILNSIIMTAPRNFLFLKLLLTACDNILARNMNDGMLSLTGPKLMYKVFKDFIKDHQNVRFQHIITNRDFSSYKNFLILDKTTGKYLFSKTTKEALNKFCVDPLHYRQLWLRNEIFFKNKVDLYNLSILVYPNPYVDTFKFTIDPDGELTIERQDCNDPWHFNLQIKVINTETSESFEKEVGVSRTLSLPKNCLRLPPHVFLSSDLKASDFNIQDNGIFVLSFIKTYTKKSADETVLFCQNIHMTNQEIEGLRPHFDSMVLFTGSDAVYHCMELSNSRTKEIYMCQVVLSILSKKNYSKIKLVFSEGNEILIPKKNIPSFISNLPTLLDKRKTINFRFFCENYADVDIPTIYNEAIASNHHLIQNLNEIIKQTGELLEGNVFYEHHSQNFDVNADFQTKRYNLFYQGKLAIDILEVGFNAGHSALLYLLANPYSHIHFFDLGEHRYSRACFDFLNSQFPGRLSVVWGDSTVTIPQFQDYRLFDFIHIDGGHTRFVAESDVHNCRSLAKENALVMIDDYNGNCLYTFCNQLLKYKKMKQQSMLYNSMYQILCSYA